MREPTSTSPTAGPLTTDPANWSDAQDSTAGLRRVIVFGSRGYEFRSAVRMRVLRLPRDVVVVVGGAPGPDKIAQITAQSAGMRTEVHYADWATHGKRAGLMRNEDMAALGADLAIGFWDGQSRGTAHMVKTCKAAGIPLEIWNADAHLVTTEEATLRLWRDRH